MGHQRSLDLICSCVVASNFSSQEEVLDCIACCVSSWCLSILIATNKDIDDDILSSIHLVWNYLLASFDSSLNICVVSSHTIHKSVAKQFSVWENTWD